MLKRIQPLYSCNEEQRMDIYEVLKTKPHSERHLARYVKFIRSRTPRSGKTEKHHICPKAMDLFPEYTSFKDHPWNRIDLSHREHYIAHLILWKAYGGSQSVAIQHMTRGIIKKSRLYESIKSSGFTHTDQAKSKMKGRKFSEEHRAKLSAALSGNQNNLGRVLSDEHKATLSSKLKGVKRGPMSDAHRKKISQSRLITKY